MRRIITLAVCAAAFAGAQTTKLDLRTQAKNADFSAFLTTKPVKSGTTLPAACGVGEIFFKTDDPAGRNLYGCTATNTWTNISGMQGPTGPTGPQGPAGAGSGDVLASGNNTFTGRNNFLNGKVRLPEATFASSPGSPATGDVWLFTDASAAGTCSGGGSAKALCRWSGSAYQSIGGGSGGGGITYTADVDMSIVIDPDAHTVKVADFIPWLTSANAWTGVNDFSNGGLLPPHKTVATLPAASSNNKKLYVVTDGTSASDCTVGGGSTRSLCLSNGTVYVALGGAGGGGGGSTSAIVTLPAGLLENGLDGTESVIDSWYSAKVAKYTNGEGRASTWWTAIPTNWTGAAPRVRVFWFNAASSSSNTYKWELTTSCDASGGMTFNTAVSTTVNDTTAGGVPQITTYASSMPITGCTAGLDIRIRIKEGTSFSSTALHYVQGIEVVWPLS